MYEQFIDDRLFVLILTPTLCPFLFSPYLPSFLHFSFIRYTFGIDLLLM